MDRELGSAQLDLPHGYEQDPTAAAHAVNDCICGRDRGHELHSSTPVQERASAYAGSTLITEKGV